MSAVSIGSLIKKLITINPALTTADLIKIVHECTEKGPASEAFANSDVINEAKAMELARISVEALAK